MDSCCENKADELAQLKGQQSKVLYIVLAINALMFLVEFFGGLLTNSTALLADSLDMFGDASVYALTLYTLHRSAQARAGAAMAKGVLMLLFGLMVIAEAIQKSLLGIVPDAVPMGGIAALALVANGACFALLHRHRRDDLNMRSTWLCSRNDLIANSSVIVAAVAVGATGSLWPDVVIGLAIAALFLRTAWQVLREAWAALASNGDPEQSADACGDGHGGGAPEGHPGAGSTDGCATGAGSQGTQCGEKDKG